MTIAALIQARLSSTRLPQKVLLPLSGKTVLEHIINRLQYCKTFNQIIVVTSTDKTDDKIVELCNSLNVLKNRSLRVLKKQ